MTNAFNVLILGANGQLARNTTRVFLRDTAAKLTLYLRRASRLNNPDPSQIEAFSCASLMLNAPPSTASTIQSMMSPAGTPFSSAPSRARLSMEMKRGRSSRGNCIAQAMASASPLSCPFCLSARNCGSLAGRSWMLSRLAAHRPSISAATVESS